MPPVQDSKSVLTALIAPRHRGTLRLLTYRLRYAVSIENRLTHVEDAIETRLARVEGAIQRLIPTGQTLDSWVRDNDRNLLYANQSPTLSQTFLHDLRPRYTVPGRQIMHP